MELIISGDVQYVNCCFTREKRTLCGERGNSKRSDPSFELWNNPEAEEIQLRIVGIVPEDMYSRPKEHVDIYILKEGSEKLQEGLEQIMDEMPDEIVLDRGDRSPRDPNISYVNDGLPLEIDSLEAWVKVRSIYATFVPGAFTLECIRTKDTVSALPRLNLETEKAKSMGHRLHIGVEIAWEKVGDAIRRRSSIKINISWRECGHLLSAINSAITKM